MKADFDDAPAYLRARKKPSPWRFVAIMGIGSAVISALAMIFGKPVLTDINQIKQGTHAGAQPWFNREPAQPMEPVSRPAVASHEAPAKEPAPARGQRQLSQEEIEWFEERTAAAVEARQTSFSDDNYTPKQPASTYTPPANHRIAKATPSTSQPRSRTVNRERATKWIKGWNGGIDYLAEWVSVNNYIDGSSVCANHRRGSIDFRECRKAAKQYFHEECRAWRARFDSDRKDRSERMRTRYCGAASSFNPMG